MEEKIEIWKPVKNFEGLYSVSSLGRVRSEARVIIQSDGKRQTIHEKILIGGKSQKLCYKFVALYKNGKCKSCRVHRLVAEAFLPNPDNLPQVGHIDENPANNAATNLEWCTAYQNCHHGHHIERVTKALINGKRSKCVYQYTKNGEFIQEWPSLGEIERQLNYSESVISACCNNKPSCKQAYGYLWKYACDVEYKHTNIEPYIEFQYRNRQDQSKCVYQYTKDGEFIREWPSTKEVERDLGFANSYIGACCNGKRKTAYGYLWKYKEDVA